MRVMVFGTFDIFHPGHKHFLAQAKKFGNNLIVVIARDQTVTRVKGKTPLNKEKGRKEVIKQSGLANVVVLGGLKNMYGVISRYKPNVICLGYDQNIFTEELQTFISESKMKTKIIRLKSFKPEIYKTSKILNKNNQSFNNF